jgi:hypothetical protein|tara:strand:+ start:290 stop:562 length:273 start_codon:yes stop_codon:yes gene_type:complete
MNEEKFKIGDLVYVTRDCYVFNIINQRAKIVTTGDLAVIVQTERPETKVNDFLMVQFWANSVKIQITDKYSGWVLIDNLILINNEKNGER